VILISALFYFKLYFLVHPETIVSGRTYVLVAFIFFYSLRNLQALSADQREILHDARSCVQFYNPSPKFW